jgi:hypothetical protein
MDLSDQGGRDEGGILLVRVGGFQTRGLVGVNDWHVASSDPRLLAALQMRCIYYRNQVIDDFSLRRAAFHLSKADKRLMSKPTCQTDAGGGFVTRVPKLNKPRRF